MGQGGLGPVCGPSCFGVNTDTAEAVEKLDEERGSGRNTNRLARVVQEPPQALEPTR
ncbi:unnamed protein product [Effrenium voratum]|uniref:Uncharacterized protein n=1 Tax=Effrenium voratum TaxID=2562239 RepID=A0AA36J707_9DINO|nr:unnamed protein product [Effrenium voratum]